MMMTNRKRRGYLRIVTFESVYNPHPVTVQQYSCTLSHSQQSVQAATKHVNSNVQKFPCMPFLWSGGTVTVVKHNICHSVQECQHVSAISVINKRKNHKHVGFLRIEPNSNFSSLLSQCSTVSQWLPC